MHRNRRLRTLVPRIWFLALCIPSFFVGFDRAKLWGAEPKGADSESEIRAVQRAIELGGKVTLLVNGKPLEVVRPSQIPKEPFHVNKINLSGSVADIDSAIQFVAELKDLRLLDVSQTAVGERGLQSVGKAKTLEILFMSTTTVGDDGIKNLAELTNLTTLFANQTRVTDTAAAQLAKLPKLNAVHLSETGLTDQGIAQLAALPLRNVAFSGNAITDRGMEALHGCTNIAVLRLSNTKVGDKGVVALRLLPKLQILDLNGTLVTDACLEALAARSSLKSLDLRMTAISEAGFHRLQKALPGCDIRWSAVEAPPPPEEVASAMQDYQTTLRAEIEPLLRDSAFERIDAIADGLRKSQARLATGALKLTQLHVVLSRVPDGAVDGQWEARIEQCREWIKQRPDSVTAHILLITLLESYAWHARGSGYASTVPAKGAVLFRERVEEAVEALRAAGEFAKQDPEWFVAAVHLAIDQGWSAEVVEELCEGSAKVDPKFLRTMIEAARYYYPQWNGKPGDLEEFATFAVSLTEEQWGKAAYARIVHQTQLQFGYRVFHDFGFSWETTKQGFQDWNRRYPPDLNRTETFCRLACDARDRETAAKLFADIGSRGSTSVWYSQEHFQRCRLWSQEDFTSGDQAQVLSPFCMDLRRITPTLEPGEVFIANGAADLLRMNLQTGKVSFVGRTTTPAIALCADPSSDDVYVATLGTEVFRSPRDSHEPTKFCQTAADTHAAVLLEQPRALATTGAQGTIQLWRLDDGWPLGEIKVGDKGCTCLAASASKKLMIVGDEAGHVYMFDSESQKRLADWQAHSRSASATAFSPDGELVATCDEQEIKIWSTDSRRQSTLIKTSAPIGNLRFTPDGKLLIGTTHQAAPEKQGRVYVWNVDGGRLVQELAGHKGPINGLALSADGQMVLTSSMDMSIRLWNVPQKRK